jgi:hypothetical protein
MGHKKYELLEYCQDRIQDKVDTLREVLGQIAEAKSKETKSSAGDKFETGRAMLQREEEQYGVQLLNALKQQQQLEEIGRALPTEAVGPGSLVITAKKRRYYFSIGLGKVVFDGETYLFVSAAAPIGKKMVGKKAGDSFSFNDQTDKIVSVA